MFTQRLLSQTAGVVPTNQHFSFVGVVEAVNQRGDGRFSATRWSYEGNGLTGWNLEIDIMQDRVFWIVAEGDLLKANRAIGATNLPGIWFVLNADGDIKHFKDIERLAIVGDKKWEHGMAMFCKPFTTAKVKYFDQSDIEQARTWLAED